MRTPAPALRTFMIAKFASRTHSYACVSRESILWFIGNLLTAGNSLALNTASTSDFYATNMLIVVVWQILRYVKLRLKKETSVDFKVLENSARRALNAETLRSFKAFRKLLKALLLHQWSGPFDLSISQWRGAHHHPNAVRTYPSIY